MTNRLEYKGFSADIQFSLEDEALIGKVLDIDSLILFSATDIDGLKREFHQSVDEYLEHCRVAGVAPEKPCKGSFNVRIGTDLHRQAATLARSKGLSLNEFVRDAVDSKVQECMSEWIGRGTKLVRSIALQTEKNPDVWGDQTLSAREGTRHEVKSRVYN